MTQDTRNTGTKENVSTEGNTRADRDARTDRHTGDDTEHPAQVGRSRKDASNELLPDLSEQGGIEPQQENPDDYSDRTRDRELEQR